MKELNQSVYYTTAQVTELVELSDQNVRKYVRLLEDRKYEVAKDEHNRRLFSANDILVLRELITKAKKPGYTLESAADEIMGEISEIISGASHKMTPGNDNNEIREMFSHVISRLDAIQEENRDLKDNIRNLVERLERYDEDNAQRYIGYVNAIENNDASMSAQVDDAGDTEVYVDNGKNAGNNGENNVVNDDLDSDDNVTEGDSDVAEEKESASQADDEENAPSVSETTDRKNVDMSDYSDSEESGRNDDQPAADEKRKTENESAEKGGFLDGLFKMFRGR